MQTRWEYLTPPEFKKLAREEQVCVVPLCSLERHGEHLPYGTDAFIGHQLAIMASQIEPCVVFPPFWLGQVHEAAAYAGAVNLPTRLLIEVLETLLDQIAHNGFKKILLLNTHGGNNPLFEYFAMSQLDRKVDYTLYSFHHASLQEYSDVRSRVLEDNSGGHACEGETSLIMAISPESVKMEYNPFKDPITPRPLLDHLPGVYTGLWWYAEYPENVSGSPTKATAEKGRQQLEDVSRGIAARIRAIKNDKTVPSLQQEYYARVAEVKNNI